MTDHGHVWVSSSAFEQVRCKRCGTPITDEPSACPVHEALESLRNTIESVASTSVLAARKAKEHAQKLGLIRGFNLAVMYFTVDGTGERPKIDTRTAMEELRKELGEEFWNAHKKSIRGQ